MVKTRGVAHATKKWKDRVAVAGPAFEEGVKDPKKDWLKETKDAESRYEDAIKVSLAEKRFGKGVDADADAKRKKRVLDVGVRRWPEGVAGAEAEYNTGMSEVISAIEGVTLPPRYPAGDPRNYERVKAIGTAVHAKLKKK